MRIIFTLLLCSLYSITSFSQNYVGNWIGEISIPNGKLDFAFKITKHGGNYNATMDIPQQGLNAAKAESAILKDTILTIAFPNFNLEYKGSLNANDEIIGNLFKGGYPAPLNLKRGEIILNRPQEPKPPFNYYSEDVTFKTSDNLKLAGTLTLPKEKGKFPVVIIISGTGPQNRDGEMFNHKPYYVIADQLTKNGIGVLRFDERGVGKSKGNFDTTTIAVSASDIKSAINYLKTRTDVNVKKIGLIGHSIGGIVAPKVASEINDINFIVLMAAPGVNGDKLMLSQKAALERTMGMNELQIAQGQELVKGAYDIVVSTNLDNQVLKDSLNSFYINKYGKMFPENQRIGLVNQITKNEILSLIRSKPSEYLEKVACPVLAINGNKDFQVPSKENLNAIKMATKKSGNKNVKTVEFENLNHLFQKCNTGMSSEYSQIEQTIAPEVLDLITNWVKEQIE
ncbi:alpha/beta hydrolase family protein [Mangrovimonas spongiae]|uniref:Alpha/beta fold hydrolase n=1 Tax=Mangrovimonas spongiae TaxID=2494697 RepID=A0A428K4H9_9FLAO|nr:alpha/beta fold hydrolase [Mangrovimonas spongiae]RSK41344.1 alpha/beta fold hydrolase [Mangrovimonas spongiae]